MILNRRERFFDDRKVPLLRLRYQQSENKTDYEDRYFDPPVPHSRPYIRLNPATWISHTAAPSFFHFSNAIIFLGSA